VGKEGGGTRPSVSTFIIIIPVVEKKKGGGKKARRRLLLGLVIPSSNIIRAKERRPLLFHQRLNFEDEGEEKRMGGEGLNVSEGALV